MRKFWWRAAKLAGGEAWQEISGHTWRSAIVYLATVALTSWLLLRNVGLSLAWENLKVIIASVLTGALLFVPLFLIKLLRAPVKMEVTQKGEHDEVQRKFKEDIARSERKIGELTKKVEALTWPDNRPMLAFHSWGQRDMNFLPETALRASQGRPQDRSPLLLEHGFYLASDGGAALDITVESFWSGPQF